MKKVVSILLCFIICVSSLVSFAQTAPADVNLEVSGLSSYAAGELAKLSCRITGLSENTPIRLELFINGKAVRSAAKETTYVPNMEETIEFFVPHNLDRAYSHTALVILKYGDTEIRKPHVFSLNAYPEISMSFFSVPLAVTPNYELYYGVEFSVPEGKSYKVQARGIARSRAVEDFREIIITNGSKDVIYVAPEKVGEKVDYFDFAYEIYGNWYEGTMRILKEHKKEKVVPANPTYSQPINPVNIPASINYNTTTYSSAALSTAVGSVAKGTIVEYLNPNNHNSMSSAKIKLPSGEIVWVSMNAVYISTQNFTIPDELTNDDLENFVNYQGYESDTGYLIWVSKERQKLYVFMGSKGKWKIYTSFPVATGKNTTPTPTTVCKYEYKTRWETSSYICDPVLSLFAGYAIHNQPVSHSGVVIDPTIGNPASAGCIRMLYDDVNWLFYYIPVKTTVVLY